MSVNSQDFQEGEGQALMLRLHEVDQKFGRATREFGWNPEPSKINPIAEQTVREYISVMRDHRDQLTEANLLDPDVYFGGNVDPVFGVLLRAMVGPQIMTPRVFDKIRDSWCHFDLPSEVDEIIRIQDDVNFVKQFESVRLDPSDNIKMSALQRIGIRSLVEEAQQKRANK